MKFNLHELVSKEDLINNRWIIFEGYANYEVWRNKDNRMIVEEIKDNQYKIHDIYNIMDKIHKTKEMK